MSKVNWFYEIGQEIKDEKRDLTIIDREIRERECFNKKNNKSYIKKEKYYKLICNKCGYDDNWWMSEDNLKKNKGCPCCANKIAVLGYNTIWDTDRWMCDLGVSEEDAKKYTHSSGQKIWVTCPDCGDKKEMLIYSIYKAHSISCTCGDGISYPEKLMCSVLKQLGIKFKTQLNKSDFSWCDKYKYDFYLEDYNIIIETHGEQHYKEGRRGRTLKEEQINDKNKKELALNNGINKYIVIDCRKSELDFIKNNILNSELSIILNLSNINWYKCEECALLNIVKEVCDYWHLHNDINNEGLTVKDIRNNFNLSNFVTNKYLHQGTKLGWCNYDPKEQTKKSAIICNSKKRKPIKIFLNRQLLGIFESTTELEKQSEELFDIKLFHQNISDVCRNKYKQYKGFTFRYATKEEYEEAVKNNTINKRINNIELEQVS